MFFDNRRSLRALITQCGILGLCLGLFTGAWISGDLARWTTSVDHIESVREVPGPAPLAPDPEIIYPPAPDPVTVVREVPGPVRVQVSRVPAPAPRSPAPALTSVPAPVARPAATAPSRTAQPVIVPPRPPVLAPTAVPSLSGAAPSMGTPPSATVTDVPARTPPSAYVDPSITTTTADRMSADAT